MIRASRPRHGEPCASVRLDSDPIGHQLLRLLAVQYSRQLQSISARRRASCPHSERFAVRSERSRSGERGRLIRLGLVLVGGRQFAQKLAGMFSGTSASGLNSPGAALSQAQGSSSGEPIASRDTSGKTGQE